MRLNPEQRHRLAETLHRHFGDDAVTYVFGSRTDDAARGGDLDLFVETPHVADYRSRAIALLHLQDALKLPVDLIVKDPLDCERPIHAVARLSGERLA